MQSEHVNTVRSLNRSGSIVRSRSISPEALGREKIRDGCGNGEGCVLYASKYAVDAFTRRLGSLR